VVADDKRPKFFERMLYIDRRWIFVGIALAVIVPYIIPGLKMSGGAVSSRTRAIYDTIDRLPPRSVVMISFDYGPASIPEMQPMAVAICKHAMSRDLRVLGVAVHSQGPLLGEEALREAAAEYGKKDGIDYVNLGYKPGGAVVIKGIGTNIYKVFPTDMAGKNCATLPVMRGVKTYNDIDFVITLSSTPIPFSWIAFAHEAYGAKLGVGVTAVMATDFYPYLQTGQLVGLINGLKGAAEYEYLIDHPASAARGMLPQSVAHLWIILTVILGNIAFFAQRAKSRRS